MDIKINEEDIMGSILKGLETIEYIRPEDIPSIDLYMDQVTTFMDSKLRKTARYPEGDKILTKTMINNYAKNDLLPPPDKKKYTKEHVLVLIFIYYYKNFLSINDIQTLLTPITDRFFANGEAFGLEEIYREVFGMEKEVVESLKEDVRKKYQEAEKSFGEAPNEQKEFLKKFAFICELSFDVYLKKMLIEKLLDEVGREQMKFHNEEKMSKKKAKENKENKESDLPGKKEPEK